ncbi:MAG: DNA-binding protein [Ileibacterium sp.]|nr:DNA-binding protein [Ileibacterium sp.]
MDHIRANELMDLYGALLTARQLEIVKLYFQEDFSLSEIQEELSISKAAVSDALRKSVQSMEKYEAILHLHQKNQMLLSLKKQHPELADEIDALLSL